MRQFERLATSIRRSAVLSRADSLWNWVRPIYLEFLNRAASNGLERNINGTDLIYLTPELYTCLETYEPEVWSHIMGSIRPGDVVADVGASLGLYTVAIAKRIGTQGYVYAFEPELQSVAWLRRNVQLNHLDERVKVFDAVVAAEAGIVEFMDGHGSESHVASTSSNEGVRPVNAITLDTVFADVKLDILKIDVEGYEEAVLRGGTDLLKDALRAPRAIFIEVHPFAWSAFHSSSETLLDLLSSFDYAIYDLQDKPVTHIDSYGEILARKNTEKCRE